MKETTCTAFLSLHETTRRRAAAKPPYILGGIKMDFLIFFAVLGGAAAANMLMWILLKLIQWVEYERKEKAFVQYCKEFIKEEF